MRVIALDARIIRLANLVEGALPQVKRVGQHVGLAAERQGVVLVALLRVLKGVTQAALHATPRIDAFLYGNLIGRALEDKAAGAGIEALVVLTHHHKINILRRLVLERTEPVVIQLHWPQVDVLFQLEPQAQQDALFQDARGHVRMADSAQHDGGEFPQFIRGAIGKHLVGLEVAVAAKVVLGEIELKAKLGAGSFNHLDVLSGDLRPRAVAAHDCNVVTIHIFFPSDITAVCEMRGERILMD